MAYEAKRINPLDLQPRKAVGLNLPFSTKEVFTSNFQTKDAIKTNLINYFLTNRGERYLNPLFGSRIREMLFENINDESIERIESIVREAVGVYFPRVQVKEVKTVPNHDENLVQFYLGYSIKDTGIDDELLINITQ
jgi:phage baseplate assembly protein W|tara:strand:+ start:7102 stop:7512 length:411 start_codon:yes stop_codon:yes gene_type:complete